MKIADISWNILFEDEKENLKETLIEAVKRGADLSCAYLSRADLGGANLRGAKLSGAYLSRADLGGANLRGAYLSGAYLRGAYLSCADLSCAYLSCADLSCAYLRGADLRGAYLRGVDFSGVDFSCADLRGADLRGADLKGADLRGADLSGAYLSGAENIPYIPLACPSEGSFTAWKKVSGKLIELEIPADARRSSATSEKCRCDKAKVISITDIATEEQISEITNTNHSITKYKVGEMVYPDAFDDNRYNECSNGIHFFIDKQLALNY